ncbi:unnamed protein product [Clavelina lepadiformis]|uniref:Zinc-finger domain-containing protein n=1 Tax=Clavelina lepadiformis TaxID=159417 RepID=A0ABP0F4I8_CLALP
MTTVTMQHSRDIRALFDESSDAEEFFGFPSSEVSSVGSSEDLLKDIEDSEKICDTDSSDESSDDDSHESIVRKQRAQLMKKKQFLDNLMKDLNSNPAFLKMKATTPQQYKRSLSPRKNPRKKTQRDIYYRDPPVTRQRSGSTKLHEPLKQRSFRSFLTVKFQMKRKQNMETNMGPKRRYSSHNAQVHEIIPVEDVTREMLNNIAQHSVGKHYDAINGTSCHQCRQKTIDTKSCCRSKDCVGVRGQFCGPCLKNRYGELVEDALLDPEWKCPVCRDFCNCSICRNRNGKCPTGILIGLARQHGHSNVKDYLDALSKNGLE